MLFLLHCSAEKVLGTRRLDSWTVPLRDSQAHQAGPGEGSLFILFEFHSSKWCVACCLLSLFVYDALYDFTLSSNDLPLPHQHAAALMSTVYEEQKDEDGFLYIQYSGESTFGN